MLPFVVHGASDWEEIEELGNQNFSAGEDYLSDGKTAEAIGEFLIAAQRFNESGQLALKAGQPADAKRIFCLPRVRI